METERIESIKLTSSDDQDFEVSRKVADCSITIKNMLEDMDGVPGAHSVPLPNVRGDILKRVIEFCEHLISLPPQSTEENKEAKVSDVTSWEKEFLKVDQATLFELILASNYLDIKPLLDATCKTVANMIRGKTPEEIRSLFNIKNDFSPEEEEQIRKENEWCDEK